MSFNWTDYLTLAQELTSRSAPSPLQEAYLRCAISRAYYAAFCQARNRLIYKDGYIMPSRANPHKVVIEEFENSSDKTRSYIGTLLRNLRSVRNIVDYEDKYRGNLSGRTRAVLREAEEVIRLLATL